MKKAKESFSFTALVFDLGTQKDQFFINPYLLGTLSSSLECISIMKKAKESFSVTALVFDLGIQKDQFFINPDLLGTLPKFTTM